MNINNNKDFRFAYYLIYVYETGEGFKNKKDFIDDLKRKVRAYSKREGRHIFSNNWDGFIELKEVPNWVETEEEAEDWFDSYERITYIPTYYDCTGQLFTAWMKLFKRNGKWMCYHRVAMDV